MRDAETVLAHIQFLGCTVNHKESNLQPRQQAEFLGVLLDSVGMTASLTPRRVDSLLGMLGHFRLGGLVTTHRVLKLMGLMSAVAAVVPLGLLRARPLQCWFNAFCLHPKSDRQRFLPVLQHQHILVRTDSTVAVYYVNHQGGTRSQWCLKVAEGLLTWAWPRLSSLRAVHSRENGD